MRQELELAVREMEDLRDNRTRQMAMVSQQSFSWPQIHQAETCLFQAILFPPTVFNLGVCWAMLPVLENRESRFFLFSRWMLSYGSVTCTVCWRKATLQRCVCLRLCCASNSREWPLRLSALVICQIKKNPIERQWRLFIFISRESKWGTLKSAGNPRCAVPAGKSLDFH